MLGMTIIACVFMTLFAIVSIMCARYQERWINVCHLVNRSSRTKPEEIYAILRNSEIREPK